MLAAIEAPGLRPRPRRAALARLDLALALTAAGKHDEATGVAHPLPGRRRPRWHERRGDGQDDRDGRAHAATAAVEAKFRIGVSRAAS